jgi:integrase
VRAAVEDRVIAHNPLDKLPVPKIPREEMRFLTVEELWRLADAIDPRYRSIVLLGGYGGLRIGEMLALRWAAVDTISQRITVVATLTDLAGTISFGQQDQSRAPRRHHPELRHGRTDRHRASSSS